MAKKKKHTYKIGQTVKFRFFDGTIHEGKVAELTYMGDVVGDKIYYNCPQYIIHVPSDRYDRGYMIYSSVTDERIKEATTYKRSINQPSPREVPQGKSGVKQKQNTTKKPMSELDMAIQKQKEFINNH